MILLGGGVMAAGELLLEPAREELRARALPPMNQTEGTANVSQRRRELYSLLGKLPARDRPVRAVKRDEREQDG